MNLLSFSFTRTAALYALACVAMGTGFAQGNSPTPKAKKPDPAQQATDNVAYRAGMETARSQARANNTVAAEQALLALNKAKPNTAAWHIETAQRLMQTAEQLSREAKPAAVPALAASALTHLNQADTLTNDAKTRAAAKSLIGYIQERYLGNRSAALTAYQGAAQLSPSSQNAKEAVARLQATEANLAAKRLGGGR